jgi:phage tail-like protein
MSDPLHVFRFRIDFFQDGVDRPTPGEGSVPLCGGSFSECSGLEATMEPKVIREGGHNYGDHQRAGYVTFATVVLKRGITTTQHLWRWFDMVAGGRTAPRLTARLVHIGVDEDPASGRGVLTWEMRNAMPVKFKAATYTANATDVGVEERHFVHEGLRLVGGGGA